jgi:hypothetical protein
LWASGVGSDATPASNAEMDQYRLETLRLLLVLMSDAMYLDPAILGANRYSAFLVTAFTDEKVAQMLLSMLNVVISYNVESWIPYNHVLFGDSREALVQTCLQTLLALLDYSDDLYTEFNVPQEDDVKARLEKEAGVGIGSPFYTPKTAKNTNKFRCLAAQLYRPRDFELIVSRFSFTRCTHFYV